MDNLGLIQKDFFLRCVFLDTAPKDEPESMLSMFTQSVSDMTF